MQSHRYMIPKLLCLFFLLQSVGLRAQVLQIGEEQLLFVDEMALLFLGGTLENQGTIENEGVIEVTGNWDNNHQYLSQSGRLSLVGSELQILEHNNQSFSQLSINNIQGVQLLSDIRISDELELIDGIISSSTEATISLAEGTAVLGGGPNSFVTTAFVTEGNGYRFFPLGDGESFLPLVLLDIQGQSPRLKVHLKSPLPAPEGLEGLDQLNRSVYWEIQTLGGQYLGSVVSLGLSSSLGLTSEVGLVVAAAADLESTYTSLGNAELIGGIFEGTLTSELPTDLPILTLGKTDEFSVEGEVLVPNAFAPASPVVDDQTLPIFAVNLLPEPFVFRIFDRWGQVVYQTQSIEEAQNTGWNGINQQNQQPAQQGVYTYYLSGMFSSGETVEKKGTLNLFR